MAYLESAKGAGARVWERKSLGEAQGQSYCRRVFVNDYNECLNFDDLEEKFSKTAIVKRQKSSSKIGSAEGEGWAGASPHKYAHEQVTDWSP